MTALTVTDLRGAALARHTLDHLRADPDQWDQFTWRTCFGGTAVQLAGGRLHGHDGDWVVAEPDEPDQRIVNGVSCVLTVNRANRLLQLVPGHGLFEMYTVCPCLGCDPGGRDIACTSHLITLDDLEQMINEAYGAVPDQGASPDPVT